MEPITVLSILNKNTDAYASERGYEYQKLKTLEAWLKNAIDKNKEVIYYDYQEDIFQRDIDNFKSTFRQIKLYSDGFSFASQEIRKTISHFFTLFCMEDYSMDEITFTFEANSHIKRAHTNNEAKLLKEWVNNQDSLSEPLLSKCISICKQIITEFIESHTGTTIDIIKAKARFEKLKNEEEFWVKFTKSIKWEFQGVEPEEAMANTIKSIKDLIKKMPYPIEKDNEESIIHSLHYHISQCATKENPEERLLSFSTLEQKILSLLGDEEKWYGEQLKKWKSLEKITHFRLGVLYELIGNSKYYRQHELLDGHREIWEYRLREILEIEGIPKFCQKDILYELIFLKLRPTLKFSFHNPDVTDLVELINRYFEIVLNNINDSMTIEDTVNLYSIVRVADAQGLISIEESKLNQWLDKIEENIGDRLLTSKPNSRCSYLESLSMVEFNLKDWRGDNRDERYVKGVEVLKEIIALKDEAKQYNYSNLLIRTNEYIKFWINHGLAEENSIFIDELEELSLDLAKIVSSREGDFSLAFHYREKAANYLQTIDNPKSLLKGLENAHKSKNLFFKDETKEGFVLSLLVICSTYQRIGFNFAAKYYALAAFFYSIQDEFLFNRVSSSLVSVNRIDFENGDWIHLFNDFDKFIELTAELNPNWNLESNQDLRVVLLDYAFVLYSVPIIAPELGVLIDSRVGELGSLKDYIDDFFKGYSEALPTKDKLLKLIKSKLIDFPLNDIGQNRVIKFFSFNILWKIQLENNFKFNSIGEEFCSILQILFTDIKTYHPHLKFDDKFNFIKVHLLESEELKFPEYMEKDVELELTMYLPKVEKPRPYYPIIMGTMIKILGKLNETNLMEVYTELLKDKDLGSKATVLRPYTELYDFFYSEERFNEFSREHFNKLNYNHDFVIKNSVVD